MFRLSIASPYTSVEVCRSHAPGLPNGLLSSGQGDLLKMGQTLKVGVGGHQELPAPESAISAVPCAVPGYANDRPCTSILRHATGNVGMMMLHRDAGQSLQGESILAGEVARMEIVGHHLGGDGEEFGEVLDTVHERAIRPVILQIANVVAQEGMLLPGQTERVLELSATGEDGAKAGRGQPQWEGGVAT